MSTSSLAIKIQQFARVFSFYASNTIFVLGIIGNIFNIIVFTKLKLFRGNRCAFYLTVESIANIYLICYAEVLILLSEIAQINLPNTSIIWCKLQTTLGQPARLFIGSIICFEALDQYLSTHYQLYLVRRQLSIERRRLDRQMTAMIFARVIMFIVLSLPYTILRIHLLNLNGLVIDTIHNAINQLATVLVSVLLSCNFSVRIFMTD